MKLTCFFLIAFLWKVNSKTIDQLIMEASKRQNNGIVFDENSETLIVEGDILKNFTEYVQERQDAMDEAKGQRKKRKAVRSESRRWTNKIVPYEIQSGTFNNQNMQQINAAINEWNTQTCLTFQPARGERNRIRFQDGGGCSSFVGMIGGTQPVTLASGCRIKRIIVHEMGHAAGFQHEQSRPDRDGFVRIRPENIPQAVLFNFDKYPSSAVNNFDVQYDYRSVMHYSARAFSNNGRITVEPLDSRFRDIIGNAPGLSFRDVKLANVMYNCNEQCSQRLTCPGEGFQGEDCTCKCPSNDPNNPVINCDSTQSVTTTPAPRVTTTTTEAPIDECTDTYDNCVRWAENGACCSKQNQAFMTMYCRAACNLCERTCKDESEDCEFWSSRGYCTMRFVEYMEMNCKKTCGLCDAKTTTVSINPNGGNNAESANTQGRNSGNRRQSSPLVLLVTALILFCGFIFK